ncbi:hypothetical protein CHELA40_14695 [Chelatococcus asaccharovorans]|nr:hypothetical protein CHELA40_14695 [Chelatococcus asaccharovorans]
MRETFPEYFPGNMAVVATWQVERAIKGGSAEAVSGTSCATRQHADAFRIGFAA